MYFDKYYYKDGNTVQQQNYFGIRIFHKFPKFWLFLLKSLNFETKNSLICEVCLSERLNNFYFAKEMHRIVHYVLDFQILRLKQQFEQYQFELNF